MIVEGYSDRSCVRIDKHKENELAEYFQPLPLQISQEGETITAMLEHP